MSKHVKDFEILNNAISSWVRKRLSSVKPKLYCYQVNELVDKDNYPWIVSLEYENDFYLTHVEGVEVDDYLYINWVSDILKNNPHCFRDSYNSWRFNSKQEVDKFQTMFTLKWS